jgi:probable selenium-dependent hydroxylase accessory protein YqeC
VGAGGKTSLMFKLARRLAAEGESVLTTTTTRIFKPSRDQSVAVIVTDSLPSILDQAKNLLDQHLHLTAAAAKLSDQGKLLGFKPEIIESLWNSRLFRWIVVEADGAAGRPLKVPAAHEPVVPVCTKRLVGIVGLNAVGRPLTEQWVFRHDRFCELTGCAPGSDVGEAAIADILVHNEGIFKSAPSSARRIAFFNQADVPPNLAAGRRIARLLSKRENTGLRRLVIGQTLFEPEVLEFYDLDKDP